MRTPTTINVHPMMQSPHRHAQQHAATENPPWSRLSKVLFSLSLCILLLPGLVFVWSPARVTLGMAGGGLVEHATAPAHAPAHTRAQPDTQPTPEAGGTSQRAKQTQNDQQGGEEKIQSSTGVNRIEVPIPTQPILTSPTPPPDPAPTPPPVPPPPPRPSLSSLLSSIPSPSSLALTSTPLFPSPHLPDPLARDSDGVTAVLTGRYDRRAGDSTEQLTNFKYQLCSFENVCLSSVEPENLFFHFRNLTTYLHYAHIFSKCAGGQHASHDHFDPSDPNYLICTCFHINFIPIMRPYEWNVSSTEEWKREIKLTEPITPELQTRIDEMDATQQVPPKGANRLYPDPLAYLSSSSVRAHSHYWGVQKWVHIHHIAHWSQKLLMFQAVMQHANLFYQPTIDAEIASKAQSSQVAWEAKRIMTPINGMVFQDSSIAMTEHERTILSLSIEAAVGRQSRAATITPVAPATGVANQRAGAGAGVPIPDFVDSTHWTDDSGAVIWSEDLHHGKYATSRDTNKDIHFSIDPHAHKHSEAPDPRAPTEYTCFKRFTYTPHYGMLAQHPHDTQRWRVLMRHHFDGQLIGSADAYSHDDIPTGWSRMVASAAGEADECPPRRITMIYRSNRIVTNYAEVMERIARRIGIDWNNTLHAPSPSTAQFDRGYLPQLQYVTIDASSSSLDQYRLFASTGLLLSSHSSQLINVLFSHPRSGVIEMTPEFHNSDFARYAADIGVNNYYYMLGGAEMQPDDPHHTGGVSSTLAMADCVARLNSDCGGRGPCVLHTSHHHCPRHPDKTNKQLNFRIIDLDRLERVIEAAIQEIETVCGGNWVKGFKQEQRGAETKQ